MAAGFRLQGGLLVIWFAASFGVVFFANDLQMIINGWPLGYWFAAQGSVFVFIAIVAVFAWLANRREGSSTSSPDPQYEAYKRRLHRKFALYVVCLLLFLAALALAEK